MFRAYLAWKNGIRQATIAESLKVSQSSVCRYIKKVKAWIEAGGKVPGLDELPQLGPQPRTFSVDPRKLDRHSGRSGPRDDE
jgi:hypothetical protein